MPASWHGSDEPRRVEPRWINFYPVPTEPDWITMLRSMDRPSREDLIPHLALRSWVLIVVGIGDGEDPARIFEMNQPGTDQQVRGRRHRQELGQALDDPQDDGLEDAHGA